MALRVAKLAAVLVEATWLAALVVLPLVFSPYGTSNFELPKALVLHALAALAIAAWTLANALGYWVNRRAQRAPWRLPGLAWVAVAGVGSWLLSSLLSIDPATSFWGSAPRGGGFLTAAAQASLLLVVADQLRTRRQWRRVVFAVLLPGAWVSGYALAQWAGFDALEYGLDFGWRSSATLGSPGALGTYLLLPMAIATERLVALRREGFGFAAVVYAACLALALAALVTTGSRAPVLGLVAGALLTILVAGVCQARALGRKSDEAGGTAVIPAQSRPQGRAAWAWRLPLFVGGAFLVVFAAWFARAPLQAASFGLGGPGGRLQESFATRLMIWQAAAEALWQPLDADVAVAEPWRRTRWRFLVGYGPESFDEVFLRHRQPFMQARLAPVVDRAHNEVFEALVTRGLLGLLASLGLVIVAVQVGLRALGLLKTSRQRDALALLLAAGGVMGSMAPYALARAYGLEGATAQLLLGVGLPLGMLLAVAVFVGSQGARWLGETNSRAAGNKAPILALLGLIVSHFVAIQLTLDTVAAATGFSITIGAVAAWTHASEGRLGSLNNMLHSSEGRRHNATEARVRGALTGLAMMTIGYGFLGAPDGFEAELAGPATAPATVAVGIWLAACLVATGAIGTLLRLAEQRVRPVSGALDATTTRFRVLGAVPIVAVVVAGGFLLPHAVATGRIGVLARSAPGAASQAVAGLWTSYYGSVLVAVVILATLMAGPWLRGARVLGGGVLLLALAAALTAGSFGAPARRAEADVYQRRAGALAASGRSQDAARLHALAAQAWPRDARHWTSWGRDLSEAAMADTSTRRRGERLRRALEHLQRAATLEPWQPGRHSDLAALHLLIAATAAPDERALVLEEAATAAEMAADLEPYSTTLRDEATRLRILAATEASR